ncbi:hypothetical protein Bpla01_21570 [Burkholderia plantarii]|nr:hypothetical protein Bpla01_21570 [Burkholderia plantarii]
MPATPHDLAGHRCINLRLPTHGGLYAREFERGGQKLGVRVEGQVSFNHAAQMPWAANDGLGLTHLPLDVLQPGGRRRAPRARARALVARVPRLSPAPPEPSADRAGAGARDRGAAPAHGLTPQPRVGTRCPHAMRRQRDR